MIRARASGSSAEEALAAIEEALNLARLDAVDVDEPPSTEPPLRPRDMPPEDLTDAKIAAAEARTDAKLAGFQGRFDVLAEKLDGIAGSIKDQRSEASSNRNVMVATTIGTGLAIIGAIVAMLSYGAATFYNGTVMRDAVNAAVAEHTSTEPKK